MYTVHVLQSLHAYIPCTVHDIELILVLGTWFLVLQDECSCRVRDQQIVLVNLPIMLYMTSKCYAPIPDYYSCSHGQLYLVI